MKTKRQLRAEAVERLNDMVLNTGSAIKKLAIALDVKWDPDNSPLSMSALQNTLVDLLTDDSTQCVCEITDNRANRCRQVEVVSATPRPMDVISAAAGCCYGKDDYSAKRVKACYQAGHMSVFEHASVTFKASGISRACSHQLVRHRLASYSQKSQRYCRVDTDTDDWYVMPFAFVQDDTELSETTDKQARFREAMHRAAEEYADALSIGIKPEDARYLLPEATKTEIVVTMNVRELFHFLDLRGGQGAQWEIRELSEAMDTAIRGISPQWGELMGLRSEYKPKES